MKGILFSLVEGSATSIAPYVTLGTLPTAIFLALVALLAMLYSDLDLVATYQTFLGAYLDQSTRAELLACR